MKSLPLLGALTSLLLAGCASDLPTDLASVFIEAPLSTSPSMKAEVVLPVSGVHIQVLPTALVKAESVLNTEVVEAGPQGLFFLGRHGVRRERHDRAFVAKLA